MRDRDWVATEGGGFHLGPREVMASIHLALRAPAARQAAIVLLGNVLAGLLGFLVALVLSRQLGPDSFGVLTTASATALTLSGLMDLGLTAGLIRFVALYLEYEPLRAEGMLQTCLLIRMAGILAFTLLCWVASPVLAGLLFHDIGYWWVVALAALGGATLSAASYVTSVLQSYHRFALVGLLPLVATATRLGLVLLIAISPSFSLGLALGIYLLSPLAGLAVGGANMPRAFLNTRGVDHRQNLSELSIFIRWLSLGLVVGSAFSRIDVLLLSGLTDNETVGIYGVAQQLVLPVVMTLGAAGTAMAPRISRFTTHLQYSRYVSMVIRLGLVWLVAGTMLSFLLVPLVGIVFGRAYAGAGGVSQVLLLAWLIATPLQLIMMLSTGMNLPQVSTFQTIAQAAICTLLSLALIPPMGAYGAAFAFLISVILCSGVAAAYVIRRVGQMEEE